MTLNDHMANDPARLALPSLLTAEDVAATLGISVKTVHKLVREGKLPCVQVTARERRFTPQQVQQYIDSQSTSIRVDKKAALVVSFRPKKGGAKSSGVFSRQALLEEMRKCR
jgi:excisionase family DNA binding protein